MSSSSSGFGESFSSCSNLLETPWSSSSGSSYCYTKCAQSPSLSCVPSCKSYTVEEELQAVKILLISYECFKDEDCRQQYLDQQASYHPAVSFYRELNKVEAEAFLSELKQKKSPSGMNCQDIRALKTVQVSFKCYQNEDERMQYLRSQSDYNPSIRRYIDMNENCVNNVLHELQQPTSGDSNLTPQAGPPHGKKIKFPHDDIFV